MTLRAVVERLAPTGEGVVRTNEGVGLIEGALPGEEVDVEIVRRSKKIWRGRVAAVVRPSADRRSGGHADGCPACDWAHVDLAAARSRKRELFLETMARIGRLPAEPFGELPIAASPAGYRLRSRFHAESRDGQAIVGGFAPRTHRVENLDGCEALTPETRAILPRLSDALSGGGPVPAEISTVETLDGSRRIARATLSFPGRPGAPERVARALAPHFSGVRIADPEGRTLAGGGDRRLWLPLLGREVPASPGAFFQANRFLTEPLARHVSELAAAVPSGRALDAFGGSGLFAAALLEAGHRVTSVEGSPEAADEAQAARSLWKAGSRWKIVRADVLEFARRDAGREEVAVADPPRAGLGIPLAQALAARATARLVYVSCDPATLARDLAAILPLGWEILDARLFDLFALTHRVEAVVALGRTGRR